MDEMIDLLAALEATGARLSMENGQLSCYAPKGALTEGLKIAIQQNKIELMLLLDERKNRDADESCSEPGSSRLNDFPLTVGAQALCILQELEPDSSTYNIPLCIDIIGKLELSRLEEAWALVLEQYPILTTRLVESSGFSILRADDSCKAHVNYMHLNIESELELVPCILSHVRRPFDLHAGPLVRIDLFQREASRAILLITVHHVIFDGASAVLLLKSFLGQYRRLLSGKPRLKQNILSGFASYADWERGMLASSEGAGHADYWRHALEGIPSSFQLLPHAGPTESDGVALTEFLSDEISESLRAIASANGVTVSSVLLAAFAIVLRRYSGETDLVICMPVSTRGQHVHDQNIGYFVNIVPIRIVCRDASSFKDLLKDVQCAMVDALYHSSYPFALISRNARSGNAGENNIFQVSFAYQDFLRPDEFKRLPEELGPEIEYRSDIVQESETDLGLQVFDRGSAVVLQLKFNRRLYEGNVIARLFANYRQLLRSAIASVDLPLSSYSILAPEEREHLITALNATSAEYPKAACIHHFFEAQAEAHPQRTAVTFVDQRLSYGELYERSEELALYLQSRGVGPDCIVGVHMHRSIEMMVALVAIVRAGGAYLPLDPAYPSERLGFMLQDSEPSIVLTQAEHADLIRPLLSDGCVTLCLDDEWVFIQKSAAALRSNGLTLRRDVASNHLCYVIYTSGSTGRPKGVLNEHGALVNRIHWMQKRYDLRSADVVLQKTPYSFDVSVWEFFWPVMVGASIVFAIPDGHKDVDYLGGLIDDQSVTTLHFVPSMFNAFLENSRGVFCSVKRIFCSGEALDKKSVDTYRNRFPNSELHNLYGPTEAAIDVTAYDCAHLPYPFVPIGKPIDNIQIYILDRDQNPQPVGVPGELYIAGDGLARGYLNRPDLTEDRFVRNPFLQDARMYRTGDLARWLEDGNIEYLGRIDTQVKIRGFRIELGEIESWLNQHSGIESAVVVARGEQAEKQVIAFFRQKVSESRKNENISQEELKNYLEKVLPEYMIPAAFVSLAAIPLTSSGKADRRALESMRIEFESTREYAPPRTPIEQQLVNIWAQVLQLAPQSIGVNDSFFEIGGHSLLATQVLSKIRGQWSVDFPLKTIFEKKTIAQLCLLIMTAERGSIPPIVPVDRLQRLPLSFSQERLWFIEQMEPGGPGYNVTGAVRIGRALDVDALEHAFVRIVDRHESLRTVFLSHDGQPYQSITTGSQFHLERVDVTGLDVEAREDAARIICHAEAEKSFDLAKGPLITAKIIKLDDCDFLLIVNMHHIISDGWSIGVLIKELGFLLNGMGASLPPLPIQYVDYSVWQRRWLDESGTLQRQLAYWQGKLAGAPEMTAPATDFPRPNMQSATGATRKFAVDRELTERLKALADHHDCTLYMVVLAAAKTLMYRYTDQVDICVGTPIANRQYEETQALIGMFVNTLALRTTVEPEGTFADTLASVKRTCLEAYENQDAPFEKVVEAMRLRRNMAISPLFQVMVSMENAGSESAVQGVENYPLETRISKFDLSFDFIETAAGMTGAIEYSTLLYRPDRIERMVDHLLSILSAVVSAQETKIKDIDFLRREREQLLFGLNDTCAPYPKDKCIHDLFAEQVALYPHRTAVQIGKRMLSYRELNQWSLDIAFHLQSHGVGPNAVVGLCVERSLEMVAGLLGILQSGGVFLPLDPDYPPERLAYMLQDSGTRLVLTQEKLMAALQAGVTPETELIVLDGAHSPVERDVPEVEGDGVGLRRTVSSGDPAYVIYTSGSTGQPKGVLVEHAGLVNHNTYARKQYCIDADDIQVQFSSMSFDLFMEEVFSVLNSGAKLILAPKDDVLSLQGLESLIDDHMISVLNVPTAFFHELATSDIRLSGLKCVIVGGERLDFAKASVFVERYPEVTLHNTYGPTETTIISAATAVTPNLLAERDFVPIGKPIDNTQIYILDANRNLLPIGIPGELHIAGDGLARGYLNRPELTLERFVENPFVPGTRMYRTGDMARWLEDGNIEYLGRIDTQVKIRGFRIELGEIEALLNQHPQIDDAVVIARGELANKQLIAFYRLKQNSIDPGRQPTQDELKAHLQNALPSFMVPAGFICLEKIPLTPNGKVDRSALENTDVQLASSRGYVAARTPTERQLVDIWAQVLQIPSQTIGVNDNFFDLGGHSLLAVRIMARTKDCFGCLIPLAALFSAPTIAEFAQLISDRGELAYDVVVQIRSGNGSAPLFAVPGAGGNVLSFRALSEAIGSDQPFFALQAVGLDGKTPPIESVEATAAVNVAAIRAIQSHGPYRLVGHSYGGVVAFEMARLLLGQGEEVDRLVLLDAIAPHVMQAQDAIDRTMDLSGLCVALAAQSGSRLKVSADELHGLTVDELADILAENELEVGGEQLDILYRVFSANLRCYERYRPAKLQHDIDVRLYRAMEQGGQAEQWPRDYGWSQILQQPPSIADMDATHFSMLQQPSVRVVADQLRSAVAVS